MKQPEQEKIVIEEKIAKRWQPVAEGKYRWAKKPEQGKYFWHMKHQMQPVNQK
jgi:hypothetical protein